MRRDGVGLEHRYLLLAIGFQCNECEMIRKEWRKYGVYLEIATLPIDLLHSLRSKDYLCVVFHSKILEHPIYIEAMRKINSIPVFIVSTLRILYKCEALILRNILQTQYGKNGYTRRLEEVEADLGQFTCEESPLTVIIDHDLYFCLEHHTVEVRGQPIELTAKEFALLALLISNPKMVFTYEILFQQVWRDEYTLTSKKTLNNHMSSLRRKLKIAPDIPDFIINIHSVGYKYDLS